MPLSTQIRCAVIATGALLFMAMRSGAQLAGMAAIRGAAPIPVGPFDLTATGSVDQIASPTIPRTALSFETRLTAPIRSGGVWIGTALEGARGIDTIPIRPLMRLGFWQAFRAIRLSVGASSHAARIGGVPGRSFSLDSFPDSASRIAMWSEVESRASWRMRRLVLEAVVAARPKVSQYGPTMWGHLEANYALNSYASLVGAMGSDAPRIALGVPAVHFASAALQLRASGSRTAMDVAPTAFVIRSIGDQRYSITYQATNASSVEMSGDFDAWRPVALRQARSGVWETTIVAAPGTYRVNVRVDGGKWVAPPGLPHVEDDFNGTVGVLVLR